MTDNRGISDGMKKLAILDANYNRAREGLRVAEDVERFYYHSVKYSKLRRLRHRLTDIFREDYEKFVKNRNVKEDRGATLKERASGGMKDVLRKNISRVAEALRVLEEVAKTERGGKAAAVKRIRFRLYEIEKDFLTRDKKAV